MPLVLPIQHTGRCVLDVWILPNLQHSSSNSAILCFALLQSATLPPRQAGDSGRPRDCRKQIHILGLAIQAVQQPVWFFTGTIRMSSNLMLLCS